MKKLLLASVATLALSVPAMAQSDHTNAQRNDQTQQMQQPRSQTQGQQQGQMNNNEQQSQNGQQQAQMIEPSKLSSEEIRQIQIGLNKAGFDAKAVDGHWGEATADALRSYQKENKLPGNGELNQQTLSSLGVNINGQGEQQTVGSSTGRDQSGQHNQKAPMQNEPSQNGQGQSSNK
jgi:hypothetical protein